MGADSSKYGVWDGWWIERFAGGGKKREGQFVAGRKVGQWTFYFPDGGVAESGAYENGDQHGLWTEYWCKEKKRTEGMYLLGRREGDWPEWDTSGQLMNVTRYRGGIRVQSFGPEQIRAEAAARNRLKPWQLGLVPQKRLNPSNN